MSVLFRNWGFLFAVATVVGHVSSAQAVLVQINGTTVFYDTFEESALGNLNGQNPSPGPGFAWSRNTPSSSIADVIDAAFPGLPAAPGAVEGDQYVRIERVSGNSIWYMANLSYGANSGDQVHAEWMMNISSNTGNIGFIAGFASNTGTDPATSITNMDPGGVGALQANQNSWDLVASNVMSFNAWQKWELDWTVGSSDLTVTINGNPLIYNGASALGNGQTYVDRFFFSAGADGTLFYVDAVPIPEPSTAVLLGLGTAVMAGRLRRKIRK